MLSDFTSSHVSGEIQPIQSAEGSFQAVSRGMYETPTLREKRAQLEKIEQHVREIKKFFLNGRRDQSFLLENVMEEQALLSREIAALERVRWQVCIRRYLCQHTETPGSAGYGRGALSSGLIESHAMHRSRLGVSVFDTPTTRAVSQPEYSIHQALLRTILNQIYEHVPDCTKADFIQLLQRHSLAVLLTDRTLLPVEHHHRLHHFQEKVMRILGHQGHIARKQSALAYIHHIVEQLSLLEEGMNEFE